MHTNPSHLEGQTQAFGDKCCFHPHGAGWDQLVFFNVVTLVQVRE